MCVSMRSCVRARALRVMHTRLSPGTSITQARMGTPGAGGTNPRASTLHRPPLGECADVCNWQHMATLVQQEREKHSAHNSSISVRIPRASSTLFTSSDVDGSSGALSSLQRSLLAQGIITNVHALRLHCRRRGPPFLPAEPRRRARSGPGARLGALRLV